MGGQGNKSAWSPGPWKSWRKKRASITKVDLATTTPKLTAFCGLLHKESVGERVSGLRDASDLLVVDSTMRDVRVKFLACLFIGICIKPFEKIWCFVESESAASTMELHSSY